MATCLTLQYIAFARTCSAVVYKILVVLLALPAVSIALLPTVVCFAAVSVVLPLCALSLQSPLFYGCVFCRIHRNAAVMCDSAVFIVLPFYRNQNTN